MRILILTAFSDELAYIQELFEDLEEIKVSNRNCFLSKRDGDAILLSSTGIGTIAAASTTTLLCENFKPDFILICGVAGGLKDNKIGDIIIGDKVIDYDLYLIHELLTDTPYKNCLIDPHTLNKVPVEFNSNKDLLKIALQIKLKDVNVGSIISSNIFPTPDDFVEKSKRFNASAIEMENVGVYKAAEHYNMPVLTVRAISNAIDNEGNDEGTANNAIDICGKNLQSFVKEFLESIKSTKVFSAPSDIEKIIQKHNLLPHPEGGWYRQTFCSNDLVKIEGEAKLRYETNVRKAGTSIIYLLTQGDFSGWHSVQSDETWYFHGGSPLKLRIINPEDKKLHNIILDVNNGYLQYTVKAGHIFSAESLGEYTLCGCAVTPGFDFADFKLFSEAEFLENFPEYSHLKRFIKVKVHKENYENID